MGKVIYPRKGEVHTVPSNFPSVGTSLNDMSWENIRKVSDAGLASSYFSVGDRKEVVLNGTVGNCTFDNYTTYAYIIGIDHNAEIEGTNRIHFQFGYTALDNDVCIAFTDSAYKTSGTSGSWFTMNNAQDNTNGWNGSHMRTVICPAFKSAMPSDLQAVLKTVTKYSDNTGGGSNTASYLTSTTDTVFLLAEFEVFGAKNFANSAEKNYQAQYAWYSAGNSKVRYRHSDTDSTAVWWSRSVRADNSTGFCYVSTSGNAGNTAAYVSYGIAPAFCV